jgi:hypothetical protein
MNGEAIILWGVERIVDDRVDRLLEIYPGAISPVGRVVLCCFHPDGRYRLVSSASRSMG